MFETWFVQDSGFESCLQTGDRSAAPGSSDPACGLGIVPVDRMDELSSTLVAAPIDPLDELLARVWG